MTGWIGDMISNIAQDARQTKQFQIDSWRSNKERDYFTADRGANWAREDNAIQRRVADARAAGVHPLFAMGASVGGSAPIYVGPSPGSPPSAGPSIDIPSSMDIAAHNASLEESKARTELLQAQKQDIVTQTAIASRNARQAQNANAQQDKIKLMADQMTSAQSVDPSVSAGRDHPAYREYVVTSHGLKMDLPYSEEGPSEALENVPFYLWPLVIQHNRAKYGDDWGTRFWKEFVMGKPPVYRTRDPRSHLGPRKQSGASGGW